MRNSSNTWWVVNLKPGESMARCPYCGCYAKIGIENISYRWLDDTRWRCPNCEENIKNEELIDD